MTHGNHVTRQPAYSGSLSQKMLAGGGLALLLIGIFLSGVNNTDPSWGKFWMIRPLILVPIAGAIGGACYHYLQTFRLQFGWKAALTIPLGVLVYILGLWMGTILGLDGTLWN